MGNTELNPCRKCGRDVEVKYIAGMSADLREMIGNQYAGAHPRWYIACECGNNIIAEYMKPTHEEQLKARKRLVSAWNTRNAAKENV